jgi:hypothetical protein
LGIRASWYSIPCLRNCSLGHSPAYRSPTTDRTPYALNTSAITLVAIALLVITGSSSARGDDEEKLHATCELLLSMSEHQRNVYFVGALNGAVAWARALTLAQEIDYFYESRLADEPAGVEDLHFHPVDPISLRVALTARF